MSDLVSQLSTHTGLTPDQIQKGLGALLNFIKKELGEEDFDKLKAAVPEASALTSQYEAAPAIEEGAPAPAGGGLFDMVASVAGKLLGGKAGGGAELMATLTKLGFKLDQIEPFLAKAFALDQNPSPPGHSGKAPGGPARACEIHGTGNQARSLTILSFVPTEISLRDDRMRAEVKRYETRSPAAQRAPTVLVRRQIHARGSGRTPGGLWEWIPDHAPQSALFDTVAATLHSLRRSSRKPGALERIHARPSGRLDRSPERLHQPAVECAQRNACSQHSIGT